MAGNRDLARQDPSRYNTAPANPSPQTNPFFDHRQLEMDGPNIPFDTYLRAQAYNRHFAQIYQEANGQNAMNVTQHPHPHHAGHFGEGGQPGSGSVAAANETNPILADMPDGFDVADLEESGDERDPSETGDVSAQGIFACPLCDLFPRGPFDPEGDYYCMCADGMDVSDLAGDDEDDSDVKMPEATQLFDNEVRSSTGEPGSDGTPGQDETSSEFAPDGTEDSTSANTNATVLTGIGEFQKSFKDVKDAEKWINQPRHKVEVAGGDDWEEVEANQHKWARKLYDAMRTLSADAAKCDKNTFKTIQDKGFERKYVEACAYRIVGRTIQVDETGSELLPGVQLKGKGKTITQIKASERLKLLVKILYRKKNVVKDVLDGWKWKIIVDQPGNRLGAAEATEVNNKRKADKLAEVKAENVRLKAELENSAGTSNATSPDAAGEVAKDQGRGTPQAVEKQVKGHGKGRSKKHSEGDEENVAEEGSYAGSGDSVLGSQRTGFGSSNSKNVSKALKTDEPDDQAGPQAGQKRKRQALQLARQGRRPGGGAARGRQEPKIASQMTDHCITAAS